MAGPLTFAGQLLVGKVVPNPVIQLVAGGVIPRWLGGGVVTPILAGGRFVTCSLAGGRFVTRRLAGGRFSIRRLTGGGHLTLPISARVGAAVVMGLQPGN